MNVRDCRRRSGWILARCFGPSPKLWCNSHRAPTHRASRRGRQVTRESGRRVGFRIKARGPFDRPTSHLCNNGADNGQRASSVSLKHALNSREPTNWLKPRELGQLSVHPFPPPPLHPQFPILTPLPSSRRPGEGRRSCLIETTKSPPDPFPACRSCCSVCVAQEEKRGRRGGGGSNENRTRNREDRSLGLNWNCHVRASEAESKEKQLV